MKHLYLIIILALSLIATQNLLAQENIPDNFWGLKYGISSKEAKAQILRDKKISPIESEEDAIMYTDVDFGGYPSQYVLLLFTNDQLYGGVVGYSTTPANVFSRYNTTVEKVKAKYGDPSSVVFDFTYPYSADDEDDHLIAIRGGYANVYTSWAFKNRYVIRVLIDKDLIVSICYLDNDIREQGDNGDSDF